MPTAKEIFDSIPPSIASCLDSTINDIHLAQLAKVMTEWRNLAPFLGLTPADKREIAENLRGDFLRQKLEVLRKWKKNHGSKAMYRRLIVLLCTHHEVSLAESLKSMLLINEEDSDLPASPSTSVIDIFREYLCECYTDLQLPSSLPWPGSHISNLH